jgi:hypothetical protein
MNHNAIAKRMDSFGRREAALMGQLAKVRERDAMLLDQLAKVQAERCEFLRGLASQADLDDDVTAQVIEPKDR